METLFHIGMAKTGSSALQRAFHRSAPRLRDLGVLYPRNPTRPGAQNHRLFALLLAPLSELPRHMKQVGSQADGDAALAALHASIAQTIAARQPRLLLMSSETMFSVSPRPEFRGRLRASLDGLGAEPSFVAYIRRPSHYYLSDMQQVLLLRAKLRQPQIPRYRTKVRAYEAEFGRNRVNLHLYDKSALKDGDIVGDFCERYLARFGVEAGKLPLDKAVNASLSAESMTIMQAFRRDFLADREDEKHTGSTNLRNILLAADSAVGAPKPRLRQEIADAIDGACRDALWIRDEYGIVFPDFDYGRLERGQSSPPPDEDRSIPQIAVVDPAIRRSIIDYVREKKWTKPRRRRWLRAISAEV